MEQGTLEDLDIATSLVGDRKFSLSEIEIVLASIGIDTDGMFREMWHVFVNALMNLEYSFDEPVSSNASWNTEWIK